MKSGQSNQKIFLLTHCESCFNKSSVFTGRIDSVLSKSGHDHAGQLALQLKDEQIDLAYRSSLIRTKQTLDYILRYHPDVKVVIDDRIIERDYGELSGENKDDYKNKHPVLYPVYHRSYDVAPPGGESMNEVEFRVLPFIKEIVAKSRQEKINILVIAHGNSIRPMIRYFENLSAEEMMKIEYLRHRIFTYQV